MTTPCTPGRAVAVGSGTRPYARHGHRLKAARLIAGQMDVGGFASQLGMKDPTYRASEAGRRPLNPSRGDRAAGRLGVSVGFLRDGTRVKSEDETAFALAERLVRFEAEGAARTGSDIHTRLCRLRRRHEYRSATAAADRMGWSADSYRSHESRRRNVPVEQAVRYGLDFEGLAGVDYLLFDEGLDMDRPPTKPMPSPSPAPTARRKIDFRRVGAPVPIRRI